MDIMGGVNAGTSEVKEGTFVSYMQVSVLISHGSKVNTSSNADHLLTVLSLK